MPKERKELPQNVQSYLKSIVTSCELEDEYVRSLQIKMWKKNEEFWHGIQFLFWSEIANDWLTPNQGLQVGILGEETRDSVGPFYDYVVNDYKAHGESIIAALSQTIPVFEFFPDDADNTDDLTAAQAKSHLAIIYQKHVKAKLQFIDALFKLYNQGLVCAYRYRCPDENLGHHEINKYKTQKVKDTKVTCPECGQELGAAQGNDILTCPECNMQGQETPFEKDEVVLDEVIKVPKDKEELELYGPLNIKVPYYARKQKDFGYLIWYIEEHFARVRSLFTEWADLIFPDAGNSKEIWARTPSSYSTAWRGGSEDSNLTSIKRIWLRPWMYEYGNDKDEEAKKYLKDKFPKGIHFTIVCENIVQFDEDDMDKCWTVGKGSPSTFIHSDPLGQSYIPIQELKNQVTNMTAQTIDYGVPALFADKRILNFDEFGNQESSPGMITPVRKPAEFDSISAGFYEQKIATPSKELEVFQSRLDEEGEFVLGDFPAIYGGASEGNTRTLGEYVQSGHRALARLSLVYEYLKVWWGQVVDKGVTALAEDIKKYGDPETTVIKDHGQFDNIKVSSEDLMGSAKNLEPEASDNFPMTSDQKMALLMRLIEMQNPMVESVIGHPENSHLITEALGWPELYIPGESQRFRALFMIKKLLSTEPTEVPIPQEVPGVQNPGQPQTKIEPSFKPDPSIDEEEIQVPMFKYFLSSEKGIQVMQKNPAGYANVKAYLDMLQESFNQKQQGKFQTQVEEGLAAKLQKKAIGA